jgi:hypothetical protein
MSTLKFIIVVSIALLSTVLVYHQAVKAYGQEVNNNGTNTTNNIDIESNRFETIESHNLLANIMAGVDVYYKYTSSLLQY